jgi:hypothetical protein
MLVLLVGGNLLKSHRNGDFIAGVIIIFVAVVTAWAIAKAAHDIKHPRKTVAQELSPETKRELAEVPRQRTEEEKQLARERFLMSEPFDRPEEVEEFFRNLDAKGQTKEP